MSETYVLWMSCLNCGNLSARRVPFGVEVKERTYGLEQDFERITCLNCGSRNVRKQKDDWGKIRPWPKGLEPLPDWLQFHHDKIMQGIRSQIQRLGSEGYLSLLDSDTRSCILRSIELSVEVEPLFQVANNLEKLARNIRKEALEKQKEILERE